MRHDFLKTPEGKTTQFEIKKEHFKYRDKGELSRYLKKHTVIKSINIRIDRADSYFLTELAKSENLSKNDLLECCFENAIEKLLRSLDMSTFHLLVSSFEAIYDCDYEKSQTNLLNSWYSIYYSGGLMQTIDQMNSYSEEDSTINKSKSYNFFVSKLREYPLLKEYIANLDDNVEEAKTSKEVNTEATDHIDTYQSSDHENLDSLTNRLNMLILKDNQKRLSENQDFHIITFRSTNKIVGMMEMISFVLEIPMNQLFYNEIHEFVADLAVFYDPENCILKNVLYKVNSKELQVQGFINVLINNGQLSFCAYAKWLESITEGRNKTKEIIDTEIQNMTVIQKDK